MIEYIQSDMFLKLIAEILGMAWLTFRSSEWMQSRKDTHAATVADAIANGVQMVYETYIRETKAAALDGKLTEQERRAARIKAINAAGEFIKPKGGAVLSYFERLAEDELHALVDRAVLAAKENIPLNKLALDKPPQV